MNFKQPLTIHIQGLPQDTHRYFEEKDELPQDLLDLTSNISPISVTKIGGYKPQKMEIIFINDRYELEGQAYMIRYKEGNFKALPIEDKVEVPILTPPKLRDYIYSLRLYIPLELVITANSWVGIYGEEELEVTFSIKDGSGSFSYSLIDRAKDYIDIYAPLP